MRFFRRPALAAVLLALLTNSACYSYQRATTTPRPATGVRFHLNDEGTVEMARYLGPNVVAVRGQLTGVLPGGALSVVPEWVTTSSHIEQPWSGEGIVEFPRSYVIGLEERVFNRRQTVLTVAATTVGLIAIATVALKSGGAQGSSAPSAGTPTR